MRRLAIVILPTAAAIAAFVYLQPAGLSPREAQESGLRSVRATRETLTVSTVALGVVKPKVGAEVKVGSRLSGVVAELAVGVGDRVLKGELLAVLDDAEWRARVEALEAELGETKARLRYARLRSDVMGGLADVAPIERASAATEVAVLEGSSSRLRARLAEARIQLGYARITAPIAGTIASVSTYEGETVAASFAAPTFVTIIDLERLEIHAYVDETDIVQVRPGQAAVIRVDAHRGRELQGVVRAVHPGAQLMNNVVNYVAVIDIGEEGAASGPREQPLLRPEMTAHVTFALERRDGALVVPRAALMREGGSSFVVVRQGDTWRRTPVETGLATPQRIEVVAGLVDGAVIVADAQRWREGRDSEEL
jgi:RND family efflux transporter MFP subunit